MQEKKTLRETSGMSRSCERYNKFMGGKDIVDSFIALYPTKKHCTRRYYLKIFFHFLDASNINAWLQYRRGYTFVKLWVSRKKTLLLYETLMRQWQSG